MNAFVKKFNLELFDDKIKEIKPNYIVTGEEVLNSLIKTAPAFIDYTPFEDEGDAIFRGIPVYVSKEVPTDKILFVKE